MSPVPHLVCFPNNANRGSLAYRKMLPAINPAMPYMCDCQNEGGVLASNAYGEPMFGFFYVTRWEPDLAGDGETATFESPSAELVRLLSDALALADGLGHALAAIHIQTACDHIKDSVCFGSAPESGI